MTYQPAVDLTQTLKPMTMLWFDNSPEATQVKVLRAADYYLRKYHCKPTVCKVHPSFPPPTDWNALYNFGIRLVVDTRALKFHLYLGQED
jgi:hypothetical protein